MIVYDKWFMNDKGNVIKMNALPAIKTAIGSEVCTMIYPEFCELVKEKRNIKDMLASRVFFTI